MAFSSAQANFRNGLDQGCVRQPRSVSYTKLAEGASWLRIPEVRHGANRFTIPRKAAFRQANHLSPTDC